jgi:hypothetical protein
MGFHLAAYFMLIIMIHDMELVQHPVMAAMLFLALIPLLAFPQAQKILIVLNPSVGGGV